jgi:hypothetical protein
VSRNNHVTRRLWRYVGRMIPPGFRGRLRRPFNRSGQRGSALILALVLSLLLLALGLGITYSSLNEFRVSEEFEKHQYALTIAEAGLNIVRFDLKGVDLDDAADRSADLPDYLGAPPPAEGSYASRNPISLHEARTIDFLNPPPALGQRSVKGYLSPPGGQTLNGGRFFAKITRITKDMSADLGFAPPNGFRRSFVPMGDGWLLATSLPSVSSISFRGFSSWPLLLGGPLSVGGEVDETGAEDETSESKDELTFYAIRIIGVYPIVPTGTGPGATRNAIAVIEAFVQRDASINIGSPVAILGPDTEATFDGNSFDVEGDDTHPGISFLYDSPGTDAFNSMTSTYNALSNNQKDNIRGADGEPYGNEPSLRDDTEAARNDPDLIRILDPNYVEAFVTAVSKCADVRYTDASTHLSGSGIELGTTDQPKIVYVGGDLILTGHGSGAGLLVVRGNFDYRGSFNYDGLVLVVGSGSVQMSGANKDLVGGMLIAHTEASGDGYSFANATFDLRGNSNVLYDGDAIGMALNQLPLSTMSWREITPEIEPDD